MIKIFNRCKHEWETKGVSYGSTFERSTDTLPFRNFTNIALCCKNCGKYKQQTLKGHIEMMFEGVRMTPGKK